MPASAKLPVAFLDAGVVIDMLRGKQPNVRLLDQSVRAKVQLATSPIVFQELFTLAEVRHNPRLIDELQSRLHLVPVDWPRSTEMLARIGDLRNQISHSNEILVLASAADCDFLVTDDRKLLNASVFEHAKVRTPEQLLAELGVR